MIAEPISLLNAPKCEPLPSRPDFRQRILVVEDERKLREQTAKELTDAGYRVDVAEDGAAAWFALRLSRYDLVITDQFMPKVTGVQLLKKMQAARMTLPVVMATGFLPTWEFTLHTWLQPVKMLLKPYSLEELLNVVESVLPRTTSAVCFQESSGPSGLAMGRGAGC
jgi:DNA-binding response OmpR family regulator